MNFQIKCEEELANIQERRDTPSLLLHACCAPCSSYVLEYLSNYFKITILYYNPNIYPVEEYERRLGELKQFLTQVTYQNPVTLVEAPYRPEDYEKAILGHENEGERSIRCYHCYHFRMEQAANYAKEHGFDYFTTTLSISPYKNSEWINEIGATLQKEYGIKYLYADFKKKNGYKRSLELSREYGLYRQDYCGCSYSYNSRQKKETLAS